MLPSSLPDRPTPPTSRSVRGEISRWLRSGTFRFGLGVIISGLSFYLALRSVPLTEVKNALLQARPDYAAWAVLAVVVNNVAKAVRWRVLLGEDGRTISLRRLTASHLAGQALNLIYPGRVGEISRVYAIGGKEVSRVFVLGTVALEKLVDLLVYSLLFILTLLLIPLPEWINRSTYILTAAALLSFLLALFAAYHVDSITRLAQAAARTMPARIQTWILPRLEPAMACLEVLQDRRAFLRLAGWTCVVWGTALFTNHAALLAMGLTLPVTASLLLLIVLQAGVTIPSVPARLGLFEYLCVLSLGRFGVDQASALGFGFLLHAVVMLPTLLPGLIALAFLGKAEEPSRFEKENESA